MKCPPACGVDEDGDNPIPIIVFSGHRLGADSVLCEKDSSQHFV